MFPDNCVGQECRTLWEGVSDGGWSSACLRPGGAYSAVAGDKIYALKPDRDERLVQLQARPQMLGCAVPSSIGCCNWQSETFEICCMPRLERLLSQARADETGVDADCIGAACFGGREIAGVACMSCWSQRLW